MKRYLSAALLALFTVPAGALTISLDADFLKTAAGDAMPVTGLVVLSTALDGNFSGPRPDAFAGVGELVLQKWDLSDFATPGVFAGIAENLQLNGSWNEGDPLRLYWYPTLTMASTAPGAGTSYGTFRSELPVDGGAAWVTPSASSTISLKFFTTDATFLSSGGSQPAADGRASLTVVPEPSSMLLLAGAGAVLGLRRGRGRRA